MYIWKKIASVSEVFLREHLVKPTSSISLVLKENLTNFAVLLPFGPQLIEFNSTLTSPVVARRLKPSRATACSTASVAYTAVACGGLGALSKSQNWPAGPWPDRTFWRWNRLFLRGLAEKPSPLCIIFWIWLIWMVSFDEKWNSH